MGQSVQFRHLTYHYLFLRIKTMRKHLHREISKNGEIDPMNALTRTIFLIKVNPFLLILLIKNQLKLNLIQKNYSLKIIPIFSPNLYLNYLILKNLIKK